MLDKSPQDWITYYDEVRKLFLQDRLKREKLFKDIPEGPQRVAIEEMKKVMIFNDDKAIEWLNKQIENLEILKKESEDKC